MSPRHPELDSGSINVDLYRKGRTLREEWIDSGSESGMTKMYKVQGDKILKNLFTYSLTHLFTSKKAAFTLAEVLITLAIIGVVAAMTIPTLVMGYKKKVTEVNLLKSYSTINQALQLAAVDHGAVSTWDKNISSVDVPAWTYEELEEWFYKYLGPYMRNVSVERRTFTYTDLTGDEVLDERLEITLNNGVILRLQGINPYDCEIVFDGAKSNIGGFDAFPFRFVEKNRYLKFEPYWPNSLEATWDGSLDTLKYSDRYGCYEASHGKGMLCTKLIQENGWKIPEDYPYFK